MTKYKISIEVESFLNPDQLRLSDFKEALALDLNCFLRDGLDEKNGYNGNDQNLLALEDGSLRFFKTWFSMQKLETNEEEEQVDLKELGILE